MRSFSIGDDDENKSNKWRSGVLVAKMMRVVMTMSSTVMQIARAKWPLTATGTVRVISWTVIVKRKMWVTGMVTHRTWVKPDPVITIRKEVEPHLSFSQVQSTPQMAALCTVYHLTCSMICNSCKDNKISMASNNKKISKKFSRRNIKRRRAAIQRSKMKKWTSTIYIIKSKAGKCNTIDFTVITTVITDIMYTSIPPTPLPLPLPLPLPRSSKPSPMQCRS